MARASQSARTFALWSVTLPWFKIKYYLACYLHQRAADPGIQSSIMYWLHVFIFWFTILIGTIKRRPVSLTYSLPQNVTNVEQYCKNIIAEARPQPFMLILWDQKQETRQFFVVFERRCLPSSSLLKAVDACFKLHFVFNVHFQTDCFASWQFLQCCVWDGHWKDERD